MGWIYLIKNKVNGKEYIGQTTQKRVETRWNREKTDPHGILKPAFAKYGLENFSFETLMEFTEIANGSNWRDCLDAHEEWIIAERKTISPNGYNLKPGGDNHAVHEETKEKLRQANLGKKHTPEHIEKHRQTLIGKKNTPEHIEKVRQALIKTVEQWDGDTIIKVWHSAGDAAKELNIHRTAISACCRGNRKTSGGFSWKYPPPILE